MRPEPSGRTIMLPALLGQVLLPLEESDFRPSWDEDSLSLEAAVQSERRLVAVPVRSPKPAIEICTVVEVDGARHVDEELYAAQLRGLRRVRFIGFHQRQPYPLVAVELLPVGPVDPEREAPLLERINNLVNLGLDPDRAAELSDLGVEDAVDRVGHLFHLTEHARRRLLNEPDLEERIGILERMLTKLSRPKPLTHRQTKEDPPTVLPVEVAQALARTEEEENRFGSGRLAQVASLLRELKWTAPAPLRIDLARARQILDSNHAGLDEVKETVMDHLALVAWRQQHGIPAGNDGGLSICLVGPPGTGKTSIAQSIAYACHRRLEHIPLGGVDDVFLVGCDRAYNSSRPGEILRRLRNSERHPSEVVFLLDEIDKLDASATRSPLSVLLALLDPSQNHRWQDQFLGSIPLDLSGALFIATANDARTISPPLLDRMRVIQLPGYSRELQISIAEHHLVPRLLTRMEITGEVEMTRETIVSLVCDYPRTDGMRQIEQRLTTVVLRALRVHLESDEVVCVDAASARSWLPIPRLRRGLGFQTGAAVNASVAEEATRGDSISKPEPRTPYSKPTPRVRRNRTRRPRLAKAPL